jgi:hypothetical protein
MLKRFKIINLKKIKINKEMILIIKYLPYQLWRNGHCPGVGDEVAVVVG